jgi:hypothetical protein
MMSHQQAHWRRAEELADTTRRYLIAIHTGGIGVCFAVASALAGSGIAPSWAWLPVAVFSGGLGTVLISLFLAKDRALARYEATDPDAVEVKWYRSSWFWDGLSALVFVGGAIAGLYQISQMLLPSPPC